MENKNKEYLEEISNMKNARVDELASLREEAYEKFRSMDNIAWEEYLIPFIDSYFDGHLPENMEFDEFINLYIKCFEKTYKEKWAEVSKAELENWNAQQT
jgi:hypothetical protein